MASDSASKQARRLPNFSAHCIFTKEQMQMYIFWLRNTRKSSGLNIQNPPFPTPFEFNAFITWLSPTPKEARRPCKHPRHPFDKFSMVFCPVCTYEIHATFLKWIECAWERKGGPFKGALEADQEYSQLKAAWHFAKTELANHVNLVEALATTQKEWEVKNPNVDVEGVRSYRAVLEMHWTQSAKDVGQKVSKKGTKVSFTPDTKDFSSETSRTNAHFNRRHNNYSAGKYACHTKDGWMDTSWARSSTASLLQLKLFIAESPSDMKGKPPGNAKFVGPLVSYQYHLAIVNWMKDFRERSTISEQAKLATLMSTCDALLVLKPEEDITGDKVRVIVRDVRPFCTEKDAEARRLEEALCSFQTQPSNEVCDSSDCVDDVMDWEYVQNHMDVDMPVNLQDTLDPEMRAQTYR
ncbi:hypothetical protein BU26DRAFT_569165 [Trematosphaeria pertusa]|uniref:Uncharacterized protein n=1 Tax=Trematosphaeria pertusa TaxID=390896 RepID=A0A6A6I1K5_9PLEO|nr:uncharacterized protein BU26DRAFT_569165 [Trematosphaeria pertusa]KAF2244166.1 hypothetical protein BU26DRAFT_569165 [Trematosphaeria pertusa]